MLLSRKIRLGRAKALAHLNQVAKRGVKHERPALWLGPQFMVFRPFRFGDSVPFTFDDASQDALREASRRVAQRAA